MRYENLYIDISPISPVWVRGYHPLENSIEKSNSIQINKDWSVIAEFFSGFGESVKFYAIEVINLNTKERIKALQVDMNIKQAEGFKAVVFFKSLICC